MQNLKWTDKIDKESDIEAKDVNTLANAIITIIDWINQDGGSSNIDLSNFYDKDEVDAALNEKAFIPSSKTYNVLSGNSIELTKQKDYILGETESLCFTCDSMGLVNGFANEVYVYFISGETPTEITTDENTSIKWLGDDCNADGIFTPQANTAYELSLKIIEITMGIGTTFDIIARVGAC